jgi:NAD(P)H-hydrate epimerase
METGTAGDGQRLLLSPQQMYEADRLAIAAGVPSLTLMDNAGRSVAEEILRRFAARPAAVLCGPGNNGGDGYVVARYLRQWGWPVWCCVSGMPRGDAAHMARSWLGETRELRAFAGAGLLVDALFGAGLSQDFPADLASAINGLGVPIVAVDIPSGLDGATGRPRGAAVRADVTVTFYRKKPGHVLLPGRLLCGEVVVTDIGIPDSAATAVAGRVSENTTPFRPTFDAHAHKYGRGHAVVVSGGPLNSGASRLAAQAALAAGAGLVTLAGSRAALAVHAAHVTAVMLAEAPEARALGRLLEDRRKNVVCLGPAAGIGHETRQMVEVAAASGAAVVLDADALTSFAGDSERLFELIRGRTCVMTPHEGEFSRLFNDLAQAIEAKHERALKAASRAGCVVVLKGADTVIAAPDGRAAINSNAPPWLATAGSGDVLAGLVTAMLAQGMAPYEAACAAVWLHGDAATRAGARGFTAERLLAGLSS